MFRPQPAGRIEKVLQPSRINLYDRKRSTHGRVPPQTPVSNDFFGTFSKQRFGSCQLEGSDLYWLYREIDVADDQRATRLDPDKFSI